MATIETEQQKLCGRIVAVDTGRVYKIVPDGDTVIIAAPSLKFVTALTREKLLDRIHDGEFEVL